MSGTTGSSAPARLPGTIENFRIYPIKMGFDDQAKIGVTFGDGFSLYRVNVMIENRSPKAYTVGLGDGITLHDQLGVAGNIRRLVGMEVVSSDPYTYTKFAVETTIPGSYGAGGYLRLIPPGFSDFVPLIFGVAVTAHPPFKFELVTQTGSVPVPVQATPASPAVPASDLATVGQPLKIGDLTATLSSIGPSSYPTSATEAKSATAPFILSDLPFLKTYPWLKGTWSFTNSGGQEEAAGFSAYLVTSTGVLHADDLQSFLGCCQVAPGQSTTNPAFWALQPAETSGPVYAVLLGVGIGGKTVTAVWKVR